MAGKLPEKCGERGWSGDAEVAFLVLLIHVCT